LTNGSAVQINLSDFGPANLFSQIQFNDLNNNTRIQTTGWHINLLNTYKGRQPFGAALVRTTGTDSPVNYGSNWSAENSAPPTIAAAGAPAFTFWYYVPLAYSENDLRGSVYANVVNATMQLNLTPNPIPVVANGTDSTSAVYVANAAGSVALAVISSMTVTVYQQYLDQLPVGNAGVVLPILDLATIYEMKNTTVTAIVPAQDFPVQYANFRDFLSTVGIFVNTGATGARGVGNDINYWALQSANFTNIWKKEPGLVQLEQSRQVIQDDPPPGVYYFSTREKPISTVQYGNMQLVLNAITAGAGAYMLMGYEDFALVQTLSMAGSLAAS
jgi:P3 major capsid protein